MAMPTRPKERQKYEYSGAANKDRRAIKAAVEGVISDMAFG
jgi:hypothetical protein